MADIEHVDIQDPQIHEPKGILSANAGEVYVADGALSGTWISTEVLKNIQYGGIYSVETDAILIGTIGTTAKKLEGFSSNMSFFGVVPDATNHQIVVTDAGDYSISLSSTFHPIAVGDAGHYELHVRVNGVESFIGGHTEVTAADFATNIPCHGILSLAASDILTVWIESDEVANTDDISLKLIQLTATLMKAA